MFCMKVDIMYFIFDFVVFVIFDDFLCIDVWVGIIVVVEVFLEVCKFVFKLIIDFGGVIGICWLSV